jgi:hypothetical protein
MAPPEEATLSDGDIIALRPLAEHVTAVHLERHPDDLERYGDDLARAWCVHDNQHVLAWAVADLDLQGQLDWLARILTARGYPVKNLIDSVSTCAEVLETDLPGAAGTEVSERLRAAARALESSAS